MSHERKPTSVAAGGGRGRAVPTVAPCCAHPALTARITEIRGLYQPGVDDRALRPAGTTKNAGYVAGYTSGDNRGRIFTNRALDGTWTRDQQYIEITVRVDAVPAECPPLPGTKIKWTIEDPDDPTNAGANVHPDAGQLLDPNDYRGGVRIGAIPNDNDSRGKAGAAAHLAEANPLYALNGDETLVDVGTMRSVVRFHVSDISGDNYRIQAMPVQPAAASCTPDRTGVMTVWDRVEIEYVKMATAAELPVDQIAQHYDMACVQVDISEKRPAPDIPQMGSSENPAYATCDNYTTAPPGGEFHHEHQGGWFFLVAAHRLMPAAVATILYEGDAQAFGNTVRLPAGTVLAGVPKVVRVFNAASIGGMAAPKPNDYNLHIKFSVKGTRRSDLVISSHDFHLVDDPDHSFLDANLTSYGFTSGSTIPIQVLSAGDDALVTAGISPGGVQVGSKHYFGGKLIVFTANLAEPQVIQTLCHELGHAFDNAHKCGNWDWEDKANRTCCCMNYWFQFVLDNASPRVPIRWSQNRPSANMCGPHLVSLRDYHLEDNPGLGWP
jgi:hypothetical protein